MKKSNIVATLLLTASAFAEANPAVDNIADTLTWAGTVPSIVAAGHSAYINSLTGSLDDAELVFERTTAGVLSMLPTALESFDVRMIEGDTVVNDYTVTLNSLSSTVGLEALPTGTFLVKHNGVGLVESIASGEVSKSDFQLELTTAGLSRLQGKEDVDVKVVANITVTTPAI